ncbi:hypothetical protein [Candidatus Cardinium hertigii]|uniref:Uncharacterized protein n=1 Tax=Candidatus Cardinium hertigii TaxID=247481 RepID=A0A3N2QBD7_9BACT|nr:hypothetical protein [Candidatus Cardinium hertigii]ROT47090.1 hypothetical protein EDM02_04340 [Candidatus Cardinium hertigii]
MHKKIKTLLVTVAHTFFSSAMVSANHINGDSVKEAYNLTKVQEIAPSPALPEALNKLMGNKEVVATGKEVIPSDTERDTEVKQEEPEVENKTLPLVTSAHKNALEFLQLFFVPKPILLPNYIPFLQHIGIKLNWFGLIRGLYTKAHQTYEGGIDLHFRGDIQLSIEIGQGNYQPNTVHNNKLYLSKGKYGSGAFLYVVHPNNNRFTNAYMGIAYGQCRFNLTPPSGGTTSMSNPRIAHWSKFILGSELTLIPHSGLYGGMQFGISRLLYCTPTVDNLKSNYIIPGYGQVVNRQINFEIIPYLKWSISFLEKKITL